MSFWNNRFELTSKQKKKKMLVWVSSFFYFFIVLVYYNSYLLLRNLKSPINTSIFACHNCKILLFACKILPLLALFDCMTLTMQLKAVPCIFGIWKVQNLGLSGKKLVFIGVWSTYLLQKAEFTSLNCYKKSNNCYVSTQVLITFVSVLPYTKNAKRKRRFFGYFFPILLPVFFC